MSAQGIDTLHAVTSPLSLILLRGQLEYLQAAGFRPAVLSAPGPRVDDLAFGDSIPAFAVPMEREIAPLADLRSLRRIWRMLCQIRPLICNAGTPKAGLLVTLAAWLARVPVRIYTMRGLRLETARGLKRCVLYVTERVTCACAHRVICVSPSLRDQALKLKLVAAEKVGVLGPGSSNGVDVNRFIPTPARSNRAADLRRNLKLSSGPVIGYVGRFTTDKGIRELVAAFDLVRAEFCHASLLMIGSYEKGDILDPEVRTRIESGDGIVAIPFQSDITSYYLAMDVFVLPTYREGFPNTVLEAQAAERPVVTTTATGAADSIVDGKTGVLVPWGDASALATAIRRLLANPAEARRMGQAGRERVEREFRQEMVWANLSELYMTLLRQRGLTVPPIADNGEGLCLQKQ